MKKADFDKEAFLAKQALEHLSAAAKVIAQMDQSNRAVAASGASIYAGSHALASQYA